MFIKRICSIGFEIIFIGLDIIGDQIGAVTGLEDFAAYETFDAYDRVFIEPYLDIISWFGSAQLRLGGKIQIYKFVDEKISIIGDDKSLIRNLNGIHFHDRSDFEIFFNTTDQFYLFIHIGIEIDSRAFETNFFSFFSDKWVGISRKLVISHNPTGKSKGCTQRIHIFRNGLAKSMSNSGNKLNQKICSHTEQDKSNNDFCIYYFFLLQLSYNHTTLYHVKKTNTVTYYNDFKE